MTAESEEEEWHERLGHLNFKYLQILKLPSKNQLCHVCYESNMVKSPLKRADEIQPSHPLEVVHSDISGPIQNSTFTNNKYIITFQMILRVIDLFTLLRKNQKRLTTSKCF